MNLHLVGQIVAVLWIAISLWIAGVNFFILSILVMGVGEQSGNPLSVRDEAGIVLFSLVSAIVVGTLAFESPGNIPSNIVYAIAPLATYVLALFAFRLLRARRGT